MTDEIDRHVGQIDRCNQRGGRMLSVVDLIEAGTLPPDLAAYALAAIGRGASFLVGANPGGAGKTTVMGALVNLVPPPVVLAPADGMGAIRQGLSSPEPRTCYICHEIGPGPYYAYLWGEELRAYFELPAAGHMLATNLHADTFEEAHRQVCRDNGVSDEAWRRVHIALFLRVEGVGSGATRRIDSVWESDGAGPHRRVWPLGEADAGTETSTPTGRWASTWVDEEQLADSRRRVDELLASGARTIADVRRCLCR
jgi:hypothetical protein